MRAYTEVLATPGVARIMAAQLMARFPQGMYSLGLLLHVERTFDSYAAAGLVLAALSIGQGVAGPLTTRWMGRWGTRPVLVLTLVVAAASLLAIALVPMGLAAMTAVGAVSGGSPMPSVRSGCRWRRTHATMAAALASTKATAKPPIGPCQSMRMPAAAEPTAAPISWPEPIHPYASGVSEKRTVAATIDDIADRAGAMPIPARKNMRASHQKSSMMHASPKPAAHTAMRIASDRRRIVTPPSARPPTSEPNAFAAITMPASKPSWPKTDTTAASDAAKPPMSSMPVTTTSTTGTFWRTPPMRLADGGMRMRPTSGEAMNQMPPSTCTTAADTRPSTVPTWVETNVMATGPTTQMISCSVASSENSRDSIRCVTIVG
jgi:hypothetical protein